MFRLRSLRTNFGRIVRTTTAELGRYSMTSLTSSPMRSKASSPSRSTSSGIISISTRGRFSGRGLRPVAFRRVWAAISSVASGAGVASGLLPLSFSASRLASS